MEWEWTRGWSRAWGIKYWYSKSFNMWLAYQHPMLVHLNACNWAGLPPYKRIYCIINRRHIQHWDFNGLLRSFDMSKFSSTSMCLQQIKLIGLWSNRTCIHYTRVVAPPIKRPLHLCTLSKHIALITSKLNMDLYTLVEHLTICPWEHFKCKWWLIKRECRHHRISYNKSGSRVINWNESSTTLNSSCSASTSFSGTWSLSSYNRRFSTPKTE